VCIFYCLVIEQKQWLSLHLFNSIRRSLSDDINDHSRIKETRVCDVSPSAPVLALAGARGPGPPWGNFGPPSYDVIISKKELMFMLYSHNMIPHA